MAVLKPRERLVYFRVSEDEFRQFVGVCEQAGARSVSDLARNAVQRLIAEGQRQRRRGQCQDRWGMHEGPSLGAFSPVGWGDRIVDLRRGLGAATADFRRNRGGRRNG